MTPKEKVQYARLKLKMTQKGLSEATGIPMVTIARWESSTKTPRFKQYGQFLEYCEKNNIKFAEDDKWKITEYFLDIMFR